VAAVSGQSGSWRISRIEAAAGRCVIQRGIPSREVVVSCASLAQDFPLPDLSSPDDMLSHAFADDDPARLMEPLKLGQL
jgi:hypothetical protein